MRPLSPIVELRLVRHLTAPGRNYGLDPFCTSANLMRLSGWQRIGVVASILWFFTGGFIGNNAGLNDAGARTTLHLIVASRPTSGVSVNTAPMTRSGRRAGSSTVSGSCAMLRAIGG
jgi:hypothetical protein